MRRECLIGLVGLFLLTGCSNGDSEKKSVKKETPVYQENPMEVSNAYAGRDAARPSDEQDKAPTAESMPQAPHILIKKKERAHLKDYGPSAGELESLKKDHLPPVESEKKNATE